MPQSPAVATGSSYYVGKEPELRDLFGATEVRVVGDRLIVDGRTYDIVDDVIVVDRPPASEMDDLGARTISSFSAEWEAYPEILPEHRTEFAMYFDLLDLERLRGRLCLDLGCGIGRWSYFVSAFTERLVLCDASRAVFVARRNLRHNPNAIFILADLRRLPFRDGVFDFVFCIGVLHHLEEDCLKLTRSLGRLTDTLLIYLYYSLDNRPWHFRALFRLAHGLRRLLSRISHESSRRSLANIITVLFYYPFILLGKIASPFGLSRQVPLYQFYGSLSFKRIAQDAYDRFFTPIEQRVSRSQIQSLTDRFSHVEISNGIPYWHFMLRKREFGGAIA